MYISFTILYSGQWSSIGYCSTRMYFATAPPPSSATVSHQASESNVVKIFGNILATSTMPSLTWPCFILMLLILTWGTCSICSIGVNSGSWVGHTLRLCFSLLRRKTVGILFHSRALRAKLPIFVGQPGSWSAGAVGWVAEPSLGIQLVPNGSVRVSLLNRIKAACAFFWFSKNFLLRRAVFVFAIRNRISPRVSPTVHQWKALRVVVRKSLKISKA